MTSDDPSKQTHTRTFLTIGLGNPGDEYADTRHNVGFMVVDLLAGQLGVTLSRNSHEALWTSAPFGDDTIVFAKPTTFMNESGHAVKSLLSDLEVDARDMIVVHDDIDLPLGEIRVKRDGSSGGHRGIESIVQSIGTDDFVRVKVGVSRPPGRQEPADYVLSEFGKKEQPEAEFAIATAAQAVMSILERGVEAAMTEYNS